ncbi:heterokaryon incompatibility protein-domain-containing protein [Xylariaceae sp. AK1471]|nr:heterokaryon incompatibility protein-domain-containing protein [Xylariaceae sp. AK1471]
MFDPAVVRDWLNCCQVHHMSCLLNRYPSTLYATEPTLNLIDCEKRRVVSYTTPDQRMELEYVALSYTWGGKDYTSTATKVGPELPDNLPLVIEDAIQATLALGYRFIWVDRYCIDQHDAFKKHEQIMNMDSIYQYAALTIIAAAGTNETYGLPGVSRRRSTKQWSFKGNNFSIASTLPSPQRSIGESRWATRGWTYQEAVLSTRRLVFTDDQLYFECNSMSSYESLHVSWDAYYSRSRPYLKEFMRPTLFSFPQTRTSFAPSVPSLKVENFSTYIHCAEQYSRRTLSFDTDSLNAFSGIIRKLETTRTFPIHHVWGVPFIRPAEETACEDSITSILSSKESIFNQWFHLIAPLSTSSQAHHLESLVIGLSWRHDKSSVPPRRRADFPSWSWVGWEGAVKWPMISQNSSVPYSTWPNMSIYFDSEGIGPTYETCHTTSVLNQLQHPRTLCIEASAMSHDAFVLVEKPQRLGISSGGEVMLYSSKQGLDSAEAFEGIQNGRYKVFRLATVGMSSYLMLVEWDHQVVHRVGTLVVREFYLHPLLFSPNVVTYRIR